MKSTMREPKNLPARKAMGGPMGPSFRLVDAPTCRTSASARFRLTSWVPKGTWAVGCPRDWPSNGME